jgi:imidazolonepropionase-like amidohydrolase
MARTFFLGTTLVDGLNAPRDRATIVVEGNKIVAVESMQDAPTPGAQDQVFDAGGYFVMPGLFQCHFHAAMDDVTSYLALDFKYPANYLTLVAARNAERMLQLGFTSAIGAGSTANIDVVLKHAINAGVISGPRITACGRHICATGESLDFHPAFWNVGFLGFGHPCDGPAEFRKAVRAEIKDGVDIVKVHVTGGHGSNYPVDVVAITVEELVAASEAAHERGKWIRTHSSNKAGILASVRAGVDLIDHTDFMDDECIEGFLKANSAITAGVHTMVRFLELVSAAKREQTQVTSERSGLSSPFYSRPAITADEAQRALDNYREFLPKALRAGVNVVSGDDVGGPGVTPHGSYADELVSYVDEIGISAKDVIAMATRNPARFLGRSDIGVIAKGKIADLLVVKGNPLEDITVLQQRSNLVVVMKDGAFVECKLTARDVGRPAMQTDSHARQSLA